MNEPIVGRVFYDEAIRERDEANQCITDLRAELAAERDAYSRAVLVQDERDEAYERMAELLNELNSARGAVDAMGALVIHRASADAYRWLLERHPATKAVRP